MQLLFLLLFISLSVGLDGSKFQGNFDTKGGSHCKWNDEKYSDKSYSILLECSCATPTGSRVTYSCEYEGNPNLCDYFDKLGGADRFFYQIIHHFQEQPHSCTLLSVDASQVTRVCSNAKVIMTKRPAGQASNSDSSKCADRSAPRRGEL